MLPIKSELAAETSYLSHAVEEILTSRLASLGISTVDPLKVQKTTGATSSDFHTLANELGTDFLITGHIAGTKEQLQIFLRLLGPDSIGAEEIHSRPVPEKQLLTEIDFLADRIKLLLTNASNVRDKTNKELSSTSKGPAVSVIKKAFHRTVPQVKAGPESVKAESREQTPSQTGSAQAEYDEGDNLLPDYPVPVEEDESSGTGRKSEQAVSISTKSVSGTEPDDSDNLLPDLPMEEHSSFRNAAIHDKRAMPTTYEKEEKGWLSWLKEHDNGQEEQKMTGLTSELPYPPPEGPVVQSAPNEVTGSSEEIVSHAGQVTRQETSQTRTTTIPPKGPIWQWQ